MFNNNIKEIELKAKEIDPDIDLSAFYDINLEEYTDRTLNRMFSFIKRGGTGIFVNQQGTNFYLSGWHHIRVKGKSISFKDYIEDPNSIVFMFKEVIPHNKIFYNYMYEMTDINHIRKSINDLESCVKQSKAYIAKANMLIVQHYTICNKYRLISFNLGPKVSELKRIALLYKNTQLTDTFKQACAKLYEDIMSTLEYNMYKANKVIANSQKL